MAKVEVDKIRIDVVGGDPDKDDLKKCFFYPTSHPGVTPIVYEFCKKENGVETTLASNITSGSSFTFTLDGWSWTIPNPAPGSEALTFVGSGSTATASGSWHNNDNQPHPAAGVGDDGNGESGTFTAQAGTTITPEDAASAAKA